MPRHVEGTARGGLLAWACACWLNEKRERGCSCSHHKLKKKKENEKKASPGGSTETPALQQRHFVLHAVLRLPAASMCSQGERRTAPRGTSYTEERKSVVITTGKGGVKLWSFGGLACMLERERTADTTENKELHRRHFPGGQQCH